jgi:hypothetical protein
MGQCPVLYDDGRIACDDAALIVRWYYLWGTKRIPYASIRSVTTRRMDEAGAKWRIWGTGDFVHWWNLDPARQRKAFALEIDTGRRIVPTVSPDDPEAVERILRGHMPKAGGGGAGGGGGGGGAGDSSGG